MSHSSSVVFLPPWQLVSSFFKRYGVEMPLFLTGGDAEEGVGAVGAGGEPLSEAARATRTETTESALVRSWR